MFYKEIKKFSIENWWVYLMLIAILNIVYYTWTWNILEILLLFVLNFVANLFIMIAIWNYWINSNKIWSIYHISWTFLFFLLWLYWVIFQDFFQYILFQISFIIAWIKAFVYYNYEKDIKIFNEKSMIIFNIILIILFTNYLNSQLFSLLQVIGFSLVTIGLVSIKDNFRFFLSITWTFFIILGSMIWVYLSYISWNIDWISLWYSLISTTALIYYIKLFPRYISKK